MKMRVLIMLGFLGFLASHVSAAAPTTQPQPLTVMDVDGQPRQPLDVAAADRAAVIIFIDADCPICNAYSGEINRLSIEYGSKGINFYVAYADPDLKPDEARKQLKEFGVTCPGLLDSSLVLARRLGATITPEAVIVGKDQNVLYRGRIDDLYTRLGERRYEATHHDLRIALDAIVAGETPPPGGPAVGCAIDLSQPPATQP